MKYAVLLGTNRMISSRSMNYEDEEMSIILNQAQWTIVHELLRPINNRAFEGFEETEIRSQNLSELIRTFQTNSFTKNSENLKHGVFVNLPQDFLYTIYESVNTNLQNCDKEIISTNPRVVQHNEYAQLLGSKYKGPNFINGETTVWRMVVNQNNGIKRHELISKGFDITSYYLRYLKKPVQIVVNEDDPSAQVNCELAKVVQERIIEIAVDLIKSNTDRQSIKNSLNLEAKL